MDLYTGKINEFVDWITGKNTYTGKPETGGLLVSGSSIRDLLLTKLQNPFYMYEDKANNRYRMFSSEDSYAMWKENPTDNQSLELFNFVRPSDYKLDLTATNSDGFNNKYIRYGDSENTGARISFSWSIYNDEGESSDSLLVKYTITNTGTGASNSFTRWYNRSDADPNFSIYNYLQPGENVVTIEASGASTGARNTKTFTIVLLLISMSSTFKFYDRFSANTPIEVPYVFERNNVQGTAKIHFVIDDGGEGKTYVRDVVQDGPTKVTEVQEIRVELEEGQHTLQIWAEAKYNDGNTVVNSNLLYYTFTIASSVIGSVGKFININTQFSSGDFPLSDLLITATLYESKQIDWGYYTDSLQTNTSISVVWKLLDGLDDLNPSILATITANSREKASTLSFMPTTYTQEGHDLYLAAYFGNTIIKYIPIYIVENTKVVVNETGFYELKMSAYGKTNNSTLKDTWQDVTETTNTTFTNIQWNDNSGWYDNSFRTVGLNEYAVINFNPLLEFDFDNGKTIEIEFESEKISDESDKIIVIGNSNGARIEITPDTATLYDNSGSEVVHTNYKSNERLKLAFIINSTQENVSNKSAEAGLAYIINNGVLERAALAQGKDFNTQGSIKIGGSDSGVRVYMIRVYNYAITYMDAYNNYLFDSENKGVIYDNNNILDASGNISFDLCKNKIDTILISGNLSNILSGLTDKDDSTTDVTLERFCPSDSTKNFKINNVQIRKHGQSTLNYPITSMKFWLNKSKSGITPVYETTLQGDLLLNKNRYVMKSYDDQGKPSIPSNKFVLQANYADSSGVHNGGLMRLIQKTWFDAQIDGEYKLRTEPLLFSTSELVHHDDTDLHEDGHIDGYSNVGGISRQWGDITNQEFPYDIRIAPDSFPCAVFYYDEEGTKTRTFLGQYVFMDDKKSDYVYGERSIYSIPSDPFCLTNTHKDDDTDENLVWDNKDVLRIEVVGSNVPFTSYMTHQDFENIITVESEGSAPVTMFNWELQFELIYPDEDDIAKDDAKKGMNKFSPNSKFRRKVKPFVDFHEWVVSTRNNQSKFEQEAAQHLDLYKMAAYYIFAMRFGLVDSLERNAQIKTYDGVHFHYEPWDMDIALGNKNDGGIAYNPPIDRNTKLPGSITTYAYSGRSANPDGSIATSNWLLDALEAWPYWSNTIVPKVADALYAAELKYNNVSKMFDENYASKWCEIMYNASGYFKYIESGKGDPTWLSWLQGARTTHRHWWLSNSMDYYDAKWFCGDYKNHYIYVRANITEGDHKNITITPNKETYMSVAKDGNRLATELVDKENPLVFDMAIGSSTKNYMYFYGANFMEEIDMSEISHGLDGILLDGVYSDVLGSPLKRLNVGVPVTQSGNDYTALLATLGCQILGTANSLLSLLSLNIRGQLNQTDTNALIYNNNLTELQEILAMGSGLINFYSSLSGNNFTNVELPDTVYTIWMNNSNWQNIEFWHATVDQMNNATLSKLTNIPSTVHNISLLGTTGSTVNSIRLIREWIQSIDADQEDYSNYTILMDKINWQDSTVGANNLLTYEELSKLAQFNGARQLSGYLVLRDTGSDLTPEQLTNIKSWFGDTVFTKNSSGLVVDHKRQYVQINIGGNITVEDGEVYLREGDRASLNATRFSLAEDDTTEYEWAISPVGDSRWYNRYNGLTVIQQTGTADGIAYILSSESSTGQNYDIRVGCFVDGIDCGSNATIHVIAATHPTNMFIDVQNKSVVATREVGDYTEFYTTGQSVRMFVNSLQSYTGTVIRTTYRFKTASTTVTYIEGGNTSEIEEFHDDYITLSKNNEKGLIVSADTFMPQEDTVVTYKIEAEVLFKSGTTITAEKNIILCDDASPIIMSTSSMYTPINTAWEEQYGSPIGRNSIYRIDLMTLEDEIDFSVVGSQLPSFVTANGSYLFKYLPACEGIIMDGCTAITNTDQSISGLDKNLMNFSAMAALKKLSIEGCTGLDDDIDLTSNSNIEEVYASGTTVNVLIPENSKITNYELGTPTEISLINPTVLTMSGIEVDSHSSISSIELVNIPDNQGYSMFGKIMGI